MDIIFKDVTYIYQENSPFEHKALDHVSFRIPSGSFTAIIGHTGSGKSTLIQHLNGLSRPTSGTVQIGEFMLSKDERPKDMKALRSKVGVVFQYPEHQLFEETVMKDIAFGPTNFGVSEAEIYRRTKEVIEAVHLPEELLERSPFDLSGGQKRRVAIAGVLAVEPDVLVLDEPTAGLDPRGQQEIMDMFRRLHEEKGLTTVLVTHSMEDALKYADHILIMNKGTKFMEGNPIDVFNQKEKLQSVQLDIPESIAFLDQFERKFNVTIPFENQSLSQLAELIKKVVQKGESSHE